MTEPMQAQIRPSSYRPRPWTVQSSVAQNSRMHFGFLFPWDRWASGCALIRPRAKTHASRYASVIPFCPEDEAGAQASPRSGCLVGPSALAKGPNKSTKALRKEKTEMKSAIEKILTTHQLLEAFNSNEDYSLKIENAPFMPLCIEKHGKLISITHYFEQNGDLLDSPAWTEIRGF